MVLERIAVCGNQSSIAASTYRIAHRVFNTQSMARLKISWYVWQKHLRVTLSALLLSISSLILRLEQLSLLLRRRWCGGGKS